MSLEGKKLRSIASELERNASSSADLKQARLAWLQAEAYSNETQASWCMARADWCNSQLAKDVLLS